MAPLPAQLAVRQRIEGLTCGFTAECASQAAIRRHRRPSTSGHGWPGNAMDLESRVTGNEVKISVGVQDGQVGAQGDGGDEAIGERSDRRARSSALQVQRRSSLVVPESFNGHTLASGDEAPEPRHVDGIPGTSQHLHDNRVGGLHLGVRLEELTNGAVRPAACGSEIFHPGRGVDKRHSRADVSPRISARSPCQPLPSISRASSRLIASPTRRRSAKSTAARLERNP